MNQRTPYSAMLPPVGALLIFFLSWPLSSPAAAGLRSSPEQEPVSSSIEVLSRGNRGASHPAIYVIRSREQLAETPMADVLRQEVLDATDFRDQAVVIVFAGTRATGGYQLDLGKVAESDGEIMIHIDETAPSPGAMVTQALTYPHIVLLLNNPPPSVIINGP